jgi:DNA replication protein DnaC
MDKWAAAGFPLRHREKLEDAAKAPRSTPDGWHVERSGPARVARDAAWRALQPRGGCVVLLGRRGTGKTQLAVELALQAARLGLDRFEGGQTYHVLNELFRAEKRTFGGDRETPRSTPIDAASAVEMLVLDEIQERFESEWEDRELTMLFDRRYREVRRTILIGNLSLKDAPTRLPASMWSRLVECAVVLECAWPSFRGARPLPRSGAS